MIRPTLNFEHADEKVTSRARAGFPEPVRRAFFVAITIDKIGYQE